MYNPQLSGVALKRNGSLFDIRAGKTYVSNMLRASGNWFHYSIDYRIGTRYMGELIADSFKKKAMECHILDRCSRFYLYC